MGTCVRARPRYSCSNGIWIENSLRVRLLSGNLARATVIQIVTCVRVIVSHTGLDGWMDRSINHGREAGEKVNYFGRNMFV